MNTAWLNSLHTLGYQVDATSGSASIAAGTERNVAFTPLTHQQIVRVQGPDSSKFLQGQLSCNLAEVSKIGSRLGAHCNIKGHMISLFRVMQQTAETLWLRGSVELTDKALATLKKYIIFSKAQAQIDDELVGFGLSGTAAAELAAELVPNLPQQPDEVSINGERLLVKVPGERYECWLPASDACALLASLSERVSLTGTDTWLLQEIRAGLVDLRQDTSEAFIPQMTNLQVFEGVSFTKGCYTGQEVVTRLQHRGILKKPMYLARVSSDRRPQPGQTLHANEKEDVGQVVLAAPNGEGQFELLAVINKEQAEHSQIHLNTCDGPALTLLELPYTLDPHLFESKR